MRTVKVVDTLVTPFETVEKDWPLTKLAETFKATGLRGLVVTDSEKHLQGIVTVADLEGARPEQTLVQDVMTSEVESVQAGDCAGAAISVMGRLQVGTVPILQDGVVVGAVNRHALMKAYQEHVHSS